MKIVHVAAGTLIQITLLSGAALLTLPATGQVCDISNAFAPPQTFGAGTAANGTALGDFNGDGNLDIAVANRNSDDVSILLGNGDGTFQPHQTFPAGTGPSAVAAGDLNGNGVLDLVVTNMNSNDASVLLGNGDGTFQPQTRYSGAGSWPMWTAIADLNGNDIPDLVVANSGNVRVMLGNGDGTFQPPTSYSAHWWPIFVAAADLNGNGILDLAVANHNSNNLSILLGNGDGTYQAPTNYNTGIWPVYIAIGDLNGNGIPDLAVANEFTTPGIVSVLHGNGDGTFQTQDLYIVGVYGSQPMSIQIHDVNSNGINDLVVVATAGVGGDLIVVLPGIGNGNFGPQHTFAVSGSPRALSLGDFNNNGAADLVVANWTTNNVSVLLSSCLPPKPGDLNGDGKVGVADLLILLAAWGSCPGPADPSGDCSGYCGGGPPSGCFCDEACMDLGDCCPDVCSGCPDLPFCDGGQVPCPADLNGDGSVGVADLLILLANWG